MTTSRRGVLAAGAAGAAALLSACGTAAKPTARRTTTSPASPSDTTSVAPTPTQAESPSATATNQRGPFKVPYGPGPLQYADLRLPPHTPLATVVVIHGGGWNATSRSDQTQPMSDALTDLGYATWNVEYRATGSGGGYPGTMEDIAAAVEKLADAAVHPGLADKVVLLGHSAGGQLAVWAASRTARTPGGPPTVAVRGTLALSGALNLTGAVTSGSALASEVVPFLGGTPRTVPLHYALSDPIRLVPASTPVWALRGTVDAVLPVNQSTDYVQAASGAGGKAYFQPVPGDHVSIVDPKGPSFPAIRALLTRLSG